MIRLVFLALFFFAFGKVAFGREISNYRRVFIPGHLSSEDSSLIVAIRRYSSEGGNFFLAVRGNDLSTIEVGESDFKYRKSPNNNADGYYGSKEVRRSRYIQALERYTSGLSFTRNHGIKKSEANVDGIFLTIDMCPSSRRFEKEYFAALAEMGAPVAIAITGSWIANHKEEFIWLLQKQHIGQLRITWINHSFSHLYYKDVKVEDNFLTLKENDIDFEITETERILLENGELPSVFFRFPGLISNRELLHKLRLYGLIPVASSAWLAKDGPNVVNGNIVLTHGNSNEHIGVEMAMALIRKTKLLPLSNAIKY